MPRRRTARPVAARRAGSFGDAAAFSFYPSKNLGALGDGGAVCTDDDRISMRLRRLGNLGQDRKAEHLEAGSNERLDEIQAAILRVKLRRLDSCNARRGELAALYRELLPADAPPLDEDPRGTCVYHLFPVRVSDRDWVRQALGRIGIRTGIHYWPALQDQPPLRFLRAPRTDLGNATAWSKQVLTLPMFAELTRGRGRGGVDRGYRRSWDQPAERQARSHTPDRGGRRPWLLGAKPASSPGRDARCAREVDL